MNIRSIHIIKAVESERMKWPSYCRLWERWVLQAARNLLGRVVYFILLRFGPEVRGSMFLRNVGTRGAHPRRQLTLIGRELFLPSSNRSHIHSLGDKKLEVLNMFVPNFIKIHLHIMTPLLEFNSFHFEDSSNSFIEFNPKASPYILRKRRLLRAPCCQSESMRPSWLFKLRP
jgi:hypothetical protein